MPTFTDGQVRENLETIERLIDKHGLYNVLEMIGAVCGEKADHLQSNWQDAISARVWTKAAKAIDNCLDHQSVRSL